MIRQLSSYRRRIVWGVLFPFLAGGFASSRWHRRPVADRTIAPPPSPRQLTQQARAYLADERLEDADDQLRQALASTRSAELLHLLGEVRQRQRNYKSARLYWQLALQSEPTAAEVHGSLGRLALEEGAVDEAIGWFRLAVKHAPRSALLCRDLGQAYKRSRRPDLAEAWLQRANQLERNAAGQKVD